MLVMSRACRQGAYMAVSALSLWPQQEAGKYKLVQVRLRRRQSRMRRKPRAICLCARARGFACAGACACVHVFVALAIWLKADSVSGASALVCLRHFGSTWLGRPGSLSVMPLCSGGAAIKAGRMFGIRPPDGDV